MVRSRAPCSSAPRALVFLRSVWLRHSNSTSHSAVFEVTKGTCASFAGQVEKTNCLGVDTPVGSIRGRAHGGGFGMLSLAVLTFSMMKEVQAADPNAIFLDDDTITYKALEHPPFEPVTPRPLPPPITVQSPRQTLPLTRTPP